jgi:hypothetical protein
MKRDSMDLICYKYEGWRPKIRPAAPKRPWMDATNERYAYRCLPLAIANSHGWELLSPCAFEAKWDGGIHMESVQIRVDPGYSDHLKPVTLFGYGTVTFHIEGIFRTPPGWNLYVTGPANLQKDAIQALSGIIETDWSPYTFTMNWRFTRPEKWIRFEENEPIAYFFPVERGKVEQFVPRIESLEENEELLRQFEKWSASRNAFQKWVVEVNPPSPSEKWQKLYYRGLNSDGQPAPVDHQSKLRLPNFTFPDGSIMDPPEAKTCPVRHQQPMTSQPLTARAPQPQNILFADRGAGTGFNSLMSNNPALALTLERIGFDAKPKSSPNGAELPVQAKPAAPSQAELALKRRDWILDVQARQRRLSKRTADIDRVRGLSGDAFLDDYYAPSRPVIIEGAMADWPALERWNADYLARAVGSAEVEYQGGRTGSCDFELLKDQHKKRMPFDRFIETINADHGNDAYITAFNSAANASALKPLERDLGWLDSYLTRVHGMMWIGPMGTFTPLHFDLTNNLIAQVVGSKRIVLAAPAETSRLYNHRHVFSQVHDITDEEQLARFPLAREAETHEVTLEAGDLIYVPLGWWHQVTALDFSVTLTYTNFKWPNLGHSSFPTG